MKQVIARVVETQHCPLYNTGDCLVFAPPTIRCDTGAPVCGIAAGQIFPALKKIYNGKRASAVKRTYCGGCGVENKAYFEFRSYSVAADLPAVANTAETREVVEHLQKTMVFAPFPEDRLRQCLRFFHSQSFPAGATLILQGQPSPGICVLLEGRVDVNRSDVTGREVTIATLDPGDCFGEMSVITGQPATATCKTIENVRLLIVPREDVGQLYQVLPNLPTMLARLVAARLAAMSAEFVKGLTSAMKGRLDQMAPADLLQAIGISRLTGVLTFENARDAGRATFGDGRILHAEVGTLTGEDAIYELVGWTNGSYEFKPGDPGPARTIDRDTTGVLLEGLRRLDEGRKETDMRVMKKE